MLSRINSIRTDMSQSPLYDITMFATCFKQSTHPSYNPSLKADQVEIAITMSFLNQDLFTQHEKTGFDKLVDPIKTYLTTLHLYLNDSIKVEVAAIHSHPVMYPNVIIDN